MLKFCSVLLIFENCTLEKLSTFRMHALRVETLIREALHFLTYMLEALKLETFSLIALILVLTSLVHVTVVDMGLVNNARKNVLFALIRFNECH
jgi:hypothetical protein